MPRNILIFAFGDLGDTILTVPAIRALRSRYPAARLVLLGKHAAASYVLPLGLVDDTVIIDKHAWDHPMSLVEPGRAYRLFKLVAGLRRRRFDTVVIFHHLVTRWGTAKYALLSLATGAGRRVGIDNGRGWFLTAAVADRGFGDRHESQYFLDVAGLLGASAQSTLEVAVSDSDVEQASDLLAGTSGSHLVAIHPGTGSYGPGRLWDPNRFALTARLIQASRDVQFVVVGTDDDRRHADILAGQLGTGCVNLTGMTSLGSLGAVLRRCSVLLANDGGVGHLAAAVGTPVVSIFGPSNDRAWRPLTAVVVSADLPCRPCFYRDYERGLPRGCASRECLRLVTPAMVATQALALLSDDPVGH
ncbi:MAG: glycosyltransferase family 9 protein [Chloroflexota bacterium]